MQGFKDPLRVLRLYCWLAAFLCIGASQAATLTGRVVRVADGDTLTVQDAQRQRWKIRLAGIDAPELHQAYGRRARLYLRRLTLHKTVYIEWQQKDRYGRLLGRLWVQPPDCPTCPWTLDAGAALLSSGLAWWYRPYAAEQEAATRQRYATAENEARNQRHGLWAETDPWPPWQWRQLHPYRSMSETSAAEVSGMDARQDRAHGQPHPEAGALH